MSSYFGGLYTATNAVSQDAITAYEQLLNFKQVMLGRYGVSPSVAKQWIEIEHPGFYECQATISFTANVATTMTMQFRKNRVATVYQISRRTNIAQPGNAGLSAPIYFAKGDNLSIYVKADDSMNLIVADAQFWVHFITTQPGSQYD